MIISLNLYNKYFKSIILLFTTYIYLLLFKGLEPSYCKVIHLQSIVSTNSTKIAIN